MAGSYGMMVNYLYGDTKSIDNNHMKFMQGELVFNEEIGKNCLTSLNL